jgi:hypothetical protein
MDYEVAMVPLGKVITQVDADQEKRSTKSPEAE